jgi:hypothetical protein
LDDEGVGVVRQAVEGGVGPHGVGEEGEPIRRGPVRGDEEGAAWMALGDDLVAVLRLGGLEPAIIPDQEVGGQVLAPLRLPRGVRPGRLQRAQALGRLEKEGRAAPLRAKRLGPRRLSHPCRAGEQPRFAPLDQEPRGEVPPGRGVKAGPPSEVQPLQGLGLLEAGALQPSLEAGGRAALAPSAPAAPRTRGRA